MRPVAVVLAVSLRASALAVVGAHPGVTITDVGLPPGDSLSHATGVNSRGQVVGVDDEHIWWWQNGDMVEIALNAGGFYQPFPKINARGQVVGLRWDGVSMFRGFVWQDGELTDIILPGDELSIASDINARGQVVGGSGVGGYYRAFLWEEGRITDLGAFPGTSCFATAINERGQVVGHCWTSDGYISGGFLWEAGVMKALNGFIPYAINAHGQIVGTSPQPALWENGVVTDVGGLPGAWYSYPTAINNAGQVIGGSFVGDTMRYTQRAFLWERGEVTDLGALGGDRSETVPVAINDRGEIAGTSLMSDGYSSHAFLWQKGTMIDLGTLDGEGYSSALSINAEGDVVGWSSGAGGEHAVRWTVHGSPTSAGMNVREP
jgi:probable HAF family extracellular repeat protein